MILLMKYFDDIIDEIFCNHHYHEDGYKRARYFILELKLFIKPVSSEGDF